MQTIIGLLLFIIIVCLFLSIKKQEHFKLWGKKNSMGKNSMGKNFMGEIRNNATFVDGIVKDWVPNITWYYRWADKFIEWERAKQGLPPLAPATPQVSVNVSATNNKYRLIGGFW